MLTYWYSSKQKQSVRCESLTVIIGCFFIKTIRVETQKTMWGPKETQEQSETTCIGIGIDFIFIMMQF